MDLDVVANETAFAINKSFKMVKFLHSDVLAHKKQSSPVLKHEII